MNKHTNQVFLYKLYTKKKKIDWFGMWQWKYPEDSDMGLGGEWN